MLDLGESMMVDRSRSIMVDMRTIGQRLRAERRAAELTQKQLADEAGSSKQAISAIERGETKQPEASTLDPICRRLNLSLRWLLEERGPKRPTVATDEDWADIAAHRVPASLGPGAAPDEYAETHRLKFRAESLRRKRLRADRLAVCYGRGDSMLPRIRSGDAILFDTTDVNPADGKLYVVSYGDELYAKRLIELGGKWFMESLNREHPQGRKPHPIDEHKNFVVHGRVRWIGSWEE